MPKYLVSGLLLSFASWVFAANTVVFEPMTTADHPNCTAPLPCRLIEPGATFEIKPIYEEKATKKTLMQINIADLKSKNVQSFRLDEMNTIDEKGFVELARVILKDAKEPALAVHAFNSAHEGPQYYYFVYNRAAKKFVMTPTTVPKLVAAPNGLGYVTELQRVPYELGPDQIFKSKAP